MKLHIHDKAFTEKPENMGKIKNEITSKATELTPKELMKELEAGKTVTCSYLGEGSKRCKDEFLVSQEVFMIDFDNSDKDRETGEYIKFEADTYRSFDEIKNDPFIQVNASFMYHSFNSSEKIERFRVVFVTDKCVRTDEAVRSIYSHLHKKFPMVDKKCVEPSRIFFGGSKAVEINFNNTLTVTDELLTPVEVNEVVKVAGTVKTSVTGSKQRQGGVPSKVGFQRERDIYTDNEIVHLFLNEDYTGLRKVFKKKFAKKCPSITVALAYLRQVSIREVFKLPKTGAFNDILHHDSKPSANVFTDKDGFERYHCHSASSPFNGDLITLVQTIMNKNFHVVSQFLISVFGITIEKNEQERDAYNAIEFLVYVLRNKNLLKSNYPDLYKVFSRDRGTVINVLNLVRDHTMYDYATGEVRCAVIMGQRKISEQIGCSLVTTNRVLKKMESVSMIETLSEGNIPDSLLKMLKRSKKQEYRYRTDIIAVPKSNNLVTDVLGACGQLVANGGAVKSTHKKKSVMINEGAERAKELFKQDANEIDKGISKTDNYNRVKLLEVANERVSTFGYATEKELAKDLKKATNYRKGTWDIDDIKGVRQFIIENLGFSMVKVNKEVKNRFPELNYNTNIYVKDREC